MVIPTSRRTSPIAGPKPAPSPPEDVQMAEADIPKLVAAKKMEVSQAKAGQKDMAKPAEGRVFRPFRQSDLSATVNYPALLKQLLETPQQVSTGLLLGMSRDLSQMVQDALKFKPSKPVDQPNAIVAHVDAQERGSRLIKFDVDVGGVQTKAVIDTGSEANICRDDVWQESGMPLDTRNRVTITDANGGKAVSEGQLWNVPIRIGSGLTLGTQVQVLKDLPVPMLLGRTWQRQNLISLSEKPEGTQVIFKDLRNPDQHFQFMLPAPHQEDIQDLRYSEQVGYAQRDISDSYVTSNGSLPLPSDPYCDIKDISHTGFQVQPVEIPAYSALDNKSEAPDITSSTLNASRSLRNREVKITIQRKPRRYSSDLEDDGSTERGNRPQPKGKPVKTKNSPRGKKTSDDEDSSESLGSPKRKLGEDQHTNSATKRSRSSSSSSSTPLISQKGKQKEDHSDNAQDDSSELSDAPSMDSVEPEIVDPAEMEARRNKFRLDTLAAEAIRYQRIFYLEHLLDALTQYGEFEKEDSEPLIAKWKARLETLRIVDKAATAKDRAEYLAPPPPPRPLRRTKAYTNLQDMAKSFIKQDSPQPSVKTLSASPRQDFH